jgi:hypothetical protein
MAKFTILLFSTAWKYSAALNSMSFETWHYTELKYKLYISIPFAWVNTEQQAQNQNWITILKIA